MDPSNTFISPKPKKSYSGSRNLIKRSSYEQSNTNFDGEVLLRASAKSAKSVDIFQNFQESLNESKSTEMSAKSPFAISPENKNQNQIQFNFFEEFEKEISGNSCHDEIMGILENSSFKQSSVSQDDLTSLNYQQSSDSVDDMFKKVNIPEFRPENPAFKNYELKFNFLDNIKKSLSEDFSLI